MARTETPAGRVRLVWDASPDQPVVTENRAWYASLVDARDQADHDMAIGARAILRIEDENGRLLWEPS